MQILGMTIAIESKVYRLERGDLGEIRITNPDGTSRLESLRAWPTAREACYDIARRIACDAYRERRRGFGPNCTNSMVHEILDAVERVAD